MSNPKLQPVLDRIDADFDNSLERLFALLRIKSISADPAFAGDCKTAAGNGVAAGRRHHSHRRRGRNRFEELRSISRSEQGGPQARLRAGVQ